MNPLGCCSVGLKTEYGIQINGLTEMKEFFTALQPEEFTRGKWSILYYENDDVLSDYLTLKKRKQELEQSGRYDVKARKEVSREFGCLLSYPVERIEEKISQGSPPTPFMLIE